jgi:NRAMP (natural resistance-associated macrophage protein)-like metal ion transporter
MTNYLYIVENQIEKFTRRKMKWWKRLGPGLITGASDDDPSGIATYSQAGSQFGYSILWTMLFSLPFMIAIQEISGRIGRITGRGIASNIRRYYSVWILYPIILLVLIANIINLGSDIGAMGDALRLLIGGPALIYCGLFVIFCVLTQIFTSYKRYTSFLKWLTLVLFSYVATVFMVHVPWNKAIRGTLIPHISLTKEYIAMFIAILGTTISPYLFFWQASQEVEEIKSHKGEKALKKTPEQAQQQFGRIRFDTYVGMGFSNLISFFIILAAAATLHAHGIKVESSTEAAETLKPIAGRFTFLLFGIGIIGTGLLAVPVLAGSAAYAVGEALKWRTGLDQKPKAAKGFYGIILTSGILGFIINLPAVQRITHLTPISALFWSAVINGIVAVPVMVILMLMTHNKKIMGQFNQQNPGLKIMGWITTLIMTLATAGLFLTWGS